MVIRAACFKILGKNKAHVFISWEWIRWVCEGKNTLPVRPVGHVLLHWKTIKKWAVFQIRVCILQRTHLKANYVTTP